MKRQLLLKVAQGCGGLLRRGGGGGGGGELTSYISACKRWRWPSHQQQQRVLVPAPTSFSHAFYSRSITTASCRCRWVTEGAGPRAMIPAGNHNASLTGKRWASTSSSEGAAADKRLAEVLRSEAEYEIKEYKPSKGVRAGPPSPFNIQDKPGTNGIILRRSFGNEDIAVSYCVQPGDYVGDEDFLGQTGEEDEEGDVPPPASPIAFTVTVTKTMNGPMLEFQCSTNGTDMVVDHVAFEVSDEDETKGMTFEGPDFSTLDNDLKSAFDHYLQVRGINGKLTSYIVQSVEDKEQREYTRWLDQVRKFVVAGR